MFWDQEIKTWDEVKDQLLPEWRSDNGEYNGPYGYYESITFDEDEDAPVKLSKSVCKKCYDEAYIYAWDDKYWQETFGISNDDLWDNEHKVLCPHINDGRSHHDQELLQDTRSEPPETCPFAMENEIMNHK